MDYSGHDWRIAGITTNEERVEAEEIVVFDEVEDLNDDDLIGIAIRGFAHPCIKNRRTLATELPCRENCEVRKTVVLRNANGTVAEYAVVPEHGLVRVNHGD